MEDITPELLEEIEKVYNAEIAKSKIIQAVRGATDMTYDKAYRYARAIGNARAKAFKNVLSSSVLPNGKMYYNIADGIIRGTLPKDFEDVCTIASKAQGAINRRMRVGLNAIIPELEDDKLMGFINRLSSEDNYDDVSWILDDPVRQFASASVDSTIKANADFQHNAGIKVTVTRTGAADCCKWCQELAGAYSYPGVPGEVFARHDNCTCSFEYNGEKLSASGHSFR